ncbi:MAG TPA: ABC transporter ATP-binding protein [Candidatus Acidoferrales bacterium]|nr:ABC transporter ATP-binding protein [Candidatus Acidoferrales bacterium]
MIGKKDKPLTIYFRLLGYVRPYKRFLGASVVSTVFYSLFSGVSIYLIVPLLNTLFSQGSPQIVSIPASASTFDRVRIAVINFVNGFIFGGTKSEALLKICVVIVAAFFLRNFFGYAQAYFMAFVEQGSMRDIRNDLYKKIQELSIGYFSSERTGSLISRITNDVFAINSGISASFVTMIREPLLVAVYLCIALFLSWKLTILSFLVAPFMLIIISRLGMRLHKEGDLSQKLIAELTSLLQETISGIKVVHSFGMERYEIGRFENHTKNYFKSILKMTHIRNLSTPITEFLSILTAGVIIYYGGMQVIQSHTLLPSEFITFLFAIFQMMPSIKELTTVSTRVYESSAAGKRIFELLDEAGKIPESPDAVNLKEFKKEIKFEDVWFKYSSSRIGRSRKADGADVLKNVSFTAHKGEILAIVGPSGGGKTTIIDLIPRFYDPTQGVIRIDGTDLRNVTVQSLRSLIGIVSQETILFNDTVRNNIAYGLTDCPSEKIIQAARAANAHDFITQLPQGYDTVIGERGTKLSGGQRQRISIARALLKNPPLMIFDEATSALDSESEMLVQEAIERLMQNRTSIVIAHRLSTIKNADRIIVVEGGEIVQRGKHQELVRQKGGIYKKLYEMQFND